MLVETRVQPVALNVPVELETKPTLPDGVLAVPASISVTAAMQSAAVELATGLGEQVMTVEVARGLTVTVLTPVLVP